MMVRDAAEFTPMPCDRSAQAISAMSTRVSWKGGSYNTRTWSTSTSRPPNHTFGCARNGTGAIA